ncbi:STAS domain-containing protein [Oerskovia sp. NPDC060287]|uniref:STAS domain-containing protein n=1 Tax=Oerskovia sp. NPDC060287 TaxID=3347095 RepID=UPI0036558421
MQGGVRIDEPGPRWTMWGEVDAAVQDRSEAELARSVERAEGPITIDLGQVTFMDSGGLRLLYLSVLGGGEPPVLVGVPERIRDLLEISGVISQFTIVD